MDLDELARKAGLELVGEVHPFWAAFPWELRNFVNEVLEEAAKAVMAEKVDAEETQSDEDEAYNTALLHAIMAIQALKLK